ncbi:archaeosortase C, PEF-CTERM variant [Methanolobus vulcani]|jgi:archaeosortase C (PEF-CTERM variant)|uniref:Archaeosortase C, PEF-CTERM variant n=1 Tax=Methanolobus vulcani TaxID=38026 RepID=A0A7Z7FD72_9EURY|nr:archaeosortase C [Methanolobus vulcani]SDF25035.1 archaeosortase C, PEF-CTERM variant [Methanolobus vulcani]
MQDENKNLIIILLVLALFTGATIELSEGSTIMGVILFIIAAILISRMKLKGEEGLQSSKNFMLIGGFIVAADLIYNYVNSSGLGTLDSMVFFLGVSLIAMGTGKRDLKQLGEFGFYISSVFTGLYLIFYSFFGFFNIDFLHLFDHYFVLMPTVAFIKIFGIPIEIIATETVILYGAKPMTIVIGGPCSGLYSMFLLIGIVAGYSRIEKMDMKKTFALLGLAVLIAYIANLIRVLILYITAYFYGMDVMMIVHTHIGWMIFAVTAGGIMYIINKK